MTCANLPREYPPKMGGYCGEEGLDVIRGIAEDLRRSGGLD